MKTMKKTYLILLAVLLSGLFTFSCKSDDDGGGGGGAAAGTIAAKINGSNFNSLEQSTSGQMITANGVTTISILGSSMDQNGITINVIGVDGTGTYPIGGGANVFTNASYLEADISNPMNSQTWQAPYDDSVAGEVNFSEISDSRVKGTFSYSCKNVNGDGSIKNITEGSFDITLN